MPLPTVFPPVPARPTRARARLVLPAIALLLPAVACRDGSGPSARRSDRIVFQSYRGGAYHIYSMKSDGSEITQLTTAGDINIHPARSPDGSRIAYISSRAPAGLHVMNADGSGDRALNPKGESDEYPAWSPDGRTIAFVRNPDPDAVTGYVVPYQVYLVDADGSNRRRLTTLPAGAALTPAWSPDGRWIVFSRDLSSEFDLFVIRADGSESRPLTSGPGGDFRPSW